MLQSTAQHGRSQHCRGIAAEQDIALAPAQKQQVTKEQKGKGTEGKGNKRERDRRNNTESEQKGDRNRKEQE